MSTEFDIDATVIEALKIEKLEAEFEPLIILMKKVLGDKVGQISISHWHIDSDSTPCVITTSEYGWSAPANDQNSIFFKLLRPYVPKGDMGINPKHPIMTSIAKKVATFNPVEKLVHDKTVHEWIWFLFESCPISSGYNFDEAMRDEDTGLNIDQISTNSGDLGGPGREGIRI